jgi:alkanesulfonate monooxygenase SsuD/methylene tetrahydromethanopterin reductase-like flavin-dependent oxidoreductase (luciferase family)
VLDQRAVVHGVLLSIAKLPGSTRSRGHTSPRALLARPDRAACDYLPATGRSEERDVVEFGLFNSVSVLPAFDGDEHRRIMDEVAIVQAAERVGFKYTWATEHHFLTEYSHMSANEVFLGYLAAATSSIHLGSGIFNITPPVNHPARVAERVALLDHLSEGRFEFGMGRGSSTVEQKGFGIPEPDVTREMFDEVVGEFKKMWRAEEYPGHEGRFFSMPARNVLPKPYSNPHPPMWVAAGNPSTFEKAARMGLGVLCFTIGGAESVKPLIELYKKEIERAEPVGDFVNDNVMVTTQLLCLEDGARVRRIATDMGMGYHRSLLLRYLDTFPRPAGIPEWPQLLPDPTREQIDAAIAEGAPYGTPDEVTRAISKYEDAGADQVVFGLLSSTLDREVACETIETFGRHVLPQFDTDPVHRTTRLRKNAASAT